MNRAFHVRRYADRAPRPLRRAPLERGLSHIDLAKRFTSDAMWHEEPRTQGDHGYRLAKNQPPDILVELPHRSQLPVWHGRRLELAKRIRHAVRAHRANRSQGITPQLGTVQRVVVGHGQRCQVRHGERFAP